MAELALEDDTLWYETHGDGSPLIFVHGGWMNGNTWQQQVKHFTNDHQVITLDVRGHGQTGATDVDRYSIDLFTDDLEALIEHLELDQPILCGLSLGSMIVQTYLDRHPDRAAGAILGGAIQSLPPVELPATMKPFLSPLPAVSTSLSVTGPETTFRTMLQSIQSMTGNRWLSVDQQVRATAMDAVGDISRTEFRKIFGALYRFEPPTLSHVETPMLVVHGDHEVPLVKRQGRNIATAVADGNWLELSNSGHLVNQDRPRAFNDASATFIDRLSVS